MTSVSYSVDNGTNWVTTAIDNTNQTITTPTIAQGGKVLWKGEGSALSKNGSSSSSSSKFSSTGNFNVCGNIMSLLYGDNFANQTSFASGSGYIFRSLFGSAVNMVNAQNLVLPATTLVEFCYHSMFYNCTSLTTAPVLPATTLTNSCYLNMFHSCTRLNYIKMLATDISANSCLLNWVEGVASNGVFTKAASMTTLPTGTSGIPTNWTVLNELSF